jgi:hypothetical protein
VIVSHGGGDFIVGFQRHPGLSRMRCVVCECEDTFLIVFHGSGGFIVGFQRHPGLSRMHCVVCKIDFLNVMHVSGGSDVNYDVIGTSIFIT